MVAAAYGGGGRADEYNFFDIPDDTLDKGAEEEYCIDQCLHGT